MILIIVLFGFCILLAAGPQGLPMVGNLAWANPTDEKIKATVAPLQIKVDSIEHQTREIKEKQEAKELSDLRQKLFETRIAQCKARGKGEDVGNPYSVRMAELQNLHFTLTKSFYNEPDCEDL